MPVEKTDVLVIGGGPAGVITALTARKNNLDIRIMLLKMEEKEMVPCPIPYVFWSLKRVEDDIMPDAPLLKNNVELVVDEAISIDKEKKSVTTKGGRKISYKKLVIATGSIPVLPPIKGIDLKGVFFIKKELSYIKELKMAVDRAKDVVIIGGGFVGVELADEIKRLGKRVTIIELLPHLLQVAFDEEFCIEMEEKLKERDVDICTSTKVEEILGEDRVESVRLSEGGAKKADVVIVVVGVKPNNKLAAEAGLKTGELGGIVVDEYMKTSEPDIFAVGDCTEDRDFFTREVTKIMLASTGTFEARTAGRNLFELKVIKRSKGTVSVFSTAIGGLVLGAAGLTETHATKRAFDFVVGTHETMDKHPGSMPGSSKIKVKLLFSRDSGIMLGGQVSGGVTVGELINMIGLAVQKNMSATEVATMQIGTHPMLTPAPTVYPLILAAEDALRKIGKKREKSEEKK